MSYCVVPVRKYTRKLTDKEMRSLESVASQFLRSKGYDIANSRLTEMFSPVGGRVVHANLYSRESTGKEEIVIVLEVPETHFGFSQTLTAPDVKEAYL